MITQGGGVVPDHAELRVREPVEREDRHEAAPDRPERGREAIGTHQAEQEAARQLAGEGHSFTVAPPARATPRRCSSAPRRVPTSAEA